MSGRVPAGSVTIIGKDRRGLTIGGDRYGIGGVCPNLVGVL